MAKRPASPGTDVVDWEKEMEAQAELAAAAQRASGGGGKFFSMKAGVLSYDGAALPGNRAAVIILADTMENSYYPAAFVEGEKSSPVCFAFAKSEAELEPHVAVDNDPYFERQHEQCQGCPQNEWGSARTGKGKACSNVMRLSMISAGTFAEKKVGRTVSVEFSGIIEDAEHYEKAEPAFMKLPVMSVKHYAAFVKLMAAEVKRPPHGVFAEVYVEPDPRSQFVVKFDLIDKVPNDLLKVIMARHAKEQAAIDFPYNSPQTADAPVAAPASNKLRGGKRK